MSEIQNLPDLSGLTRKEAQEVFSIMDFKFKRRTAGGYERYEHADGSQVWIRPNGEVMRLGPKAKGKKYRPRFNQHGKPTQAHSTGERLTETGR